MADSPKAKSDVVAAGRAVGEALLRYSRMTHAGVVIGGAAILDVKLEKCLKQAMRPMSKKLYGELFGPMRALGSFAPKIVMAYALRVIDLDMYRELEKIRKIRNVFAHTDDLLNLHSEKIAPLYGQLKHPEHIKYFDTHRDRAFLDCCGLIEKSLDAYLGKMRESGTDHNF